MDNNDHSSIRPQGKPAPLAKPEFFRRPQPMSDLDAFPVCPDVLRPRTIKPGETADSVADLLHGEVGDLWSACVDGLHSGFYGHDPRRLYRVAERLYQISLNLQELRKRERGIGAGR